MYGLNSLGTVLHFAPRVNYLPDPSPLNPLTALQQQREIEFNLEMNIESNKLHSPDPSRATHRTS